MKPSLHTLRLLLAVSLPICLGMGKFPPDLEGLFDCAWWGQQLAEEEQDDGNGKQTAEERFEDDPAADIANEDIGSDSFGQTPDVASPPPDPGQGQGQEGKRRSGPPAGVPDAVKRPHIDPRMPSNQGPSYKPPM